MKVQIVKFEDISSVVENKQVNSEKEEFNLTNEFIILKMIKMN